MDGEAIVKLTVDSEDPNMSGVLPIRCIDVRIYRKLNYSFTVHTFMKSVL